MKYFLLLVQEMEVKIPAPICEVVAHAAAPPLRLPSLVLHRRLTLTAPLLSNHSLATPTTHPRDLISINSSPALCLHSRKVPPSNWAPDRYTNQHYQRWIQSFTWFFQCWGLFAARAYVSALTVLSELCYGDINVLIFLVLYPCDAPVVSSVLN